jgi:hypothetical protein
MLRLAPGPSSCVLRIEQGRIERMGGCGFQIFDRSAQAHILRLQRGEDPDRHAESQGSSCIHRRLRANDTIPCTLTP